MSFYLKAARMFIVIIDIVVLISCILNFVRLTMALHAWHNSSSKFQCTLFLKLGSHLRSVVNSGHQTFHAASCFS